MPINIIAYPPGGGGNHVRNLCDLDGRFQDQWPWDWVRQQRVGLAPYDSPQDQPAAGYQPGEVHSLPGRNIHKVFVDHVKEHPHGDYLLHGHFGELAPFADCIRHWPKVNWLTVTLDHPQDRGLLLARQQRLQYHPYWVEEEQIYLYRPSMYQFFFGADPDRIHSLPLRQLWQRDLGSSGVIDGLQRAFDVSIDLPAAQTLHDKWCRLNFGTVQVAPLP